MAVTPDDVNAEVAGVFYFTGLDGVQGKWHLEAPLLTQDAARLQCLTFCVILLRNGWVTYGYSACADTSEYNENLQP